jgi:hypothetical protein
MFVSPFSFLQCFGIRFYHLVNLYNKYFIFFFASNAQSHEFHFTLLISSHSFLTQFCVTPLHSYFVSNDVSFFTNHDSKSDDIAMSGTGPSVSGSDMGSFSSTSKCISSNELLSTSAAKQGNGKRYSNKISVIK